MQVSSFDIIPKYLIQQIREPNWTPERLEIIGPHLMNSFFHVVYVLVDKAHRINGFMWVTINPLNQNLILNTLSLNKKLWKAFFSRDLVYPFLVNLMNELGLKRLTCYTDKPKAFIRMGFKLSGEVRIEG